MLRWIFILFATLGMGRFFAVEAQSPAQSATQPAPVKPRIAIWNPETGTNSSRFKIDLAWLNQVETWLRQDNIEVARLTAEQLEDTETFSAAKFDALMMPGDAFPRRNAAVLQRFTADGGILISLGAGPVPFLVSIAQDGNDWRPSPFAPDKAWETSEIYDKILGLVYNDVAARRDDGVRHETTSLFQEYLATPQLPIIEQRLPSRWLAPRMGTTLYPLIRSRRADGSDTVPQLFVVQNQTPDGTKTGIVALSDVWTKPLNAEPTANSPASWPLTRQTVATLAHIASDLKAGVLTLSPSDKITLLDESSALPDEH